MIGWLTRFLLFLSAYSPLYLVAAILGWDRFQWWSLGPLTIGLISLLSLPLIRFYVGDTRAGTLVVKEVARKDADVVPYLLGYLVPFIDLDFSSNSKLAAMVVIFISIGLTQVAANLIHLNPVLLLLGWHVYEVKDSDGTSSTVITRHKHLRENTRLQVVTLTESYIHWAKNND